MPEFPAVPSKVSLSDLSSSESDPGYPADSDGNATAATNVANERLKKKKKKKIGESLANIVLPPGFLNPLPLKDRSFSSSAPLASGVPVPSASKDNPAHSFDDNSTKFSKVGYNKCASPSLGAAMVAFVAAHAEKKDESKDQEDVLEEPDVKAEKSLKKGDSAKGKGKARNDVVAAAIQGTRTKHIANEKMATKAAEMEVKGDVATCETAMRSLAMMIKKKRSSAKTSGQRMAKREKTEGPTEPLPPIAEQTDSIMEQFEAREAGKDMHDPDIQMEEIRGPVASTELLPTEAKVKVADPEVSAKVSCPREGMGLDMLKRFMGHEKHMASPNVRENSLPRGEDLEEPSSLRGACQTDKENERNCGAGESTSWITSMFSEAYLSELACYVKTLKKDDLDKLILASACQQLIATFEMGKRASNQSARITELEAENAGIKKELEDKRQKDGEKIQQLQEELDKCTRNLMEMEVRLLNDFRAKVGRLEKAERELKTQLANSIKKMKEALAKQEADLEAKYLERETALTTQLLAAEAKVAEVEDCVKKWHE